MEKYSTITIRETQESKTVRISSDLKPEIINSVISKWQSLLDTIAKIVNVPSGLIMRLNEDTIEVFLKSRTKGNPYEVGEEAKLIYGLYCETVIGTQKELLIPDATKSLIWNKNNPDIDINMISYLGFPINWPDGESFGTICLLDKKENNYSNEYRDLLRLIKLHIETDLQLLMANKNLNEKNVDLEKLNNTKTRFLSLISHDVRGGISTAHEFLKLIIENIGEFDPSDLKEMLTSLSQNVSSANLALENLLNWTKSDLVQLEPYIKQVDIIDIIEELLRYFKLAIDTKDLNVKKEYYTKKAFLASDENMLRVSIRNILSNALKYTHKGGTITIRVFLSNNHHIIEIEDTGVGMAMSSIDRLFSYDHLHKKRGTQGENSAGLGLILTKEFLDKINVVVKIESEVGKGTKFILTFP